MDSGNFFKIREGSDLFKGQILFSYTGLKMKNKPEYPVFVVFKDEHINFLFSGQIQKDKKEGAFNDIGPYPEFVENKLFSLNLHKGKENVLILNDTLRVLFNSKFPVIKDVVITKTNSNRTNYHITYADLEIFSINTKENEEGKKLYYRTLILDFLFDVYHSNVFENSPAFTQIKQHLDEIPFIQAIKRKAEFYYQVKNNRVTEKLVTFDTTNSHYIENLTKAQQEWLEILQEEGSHKIINKDNRWFEDVEAEGKEVFKKQLKIKDFARNWANYRNSLISNKNASLKWFIKRNNIRDAWGSFDRLKWIGLGFLILLGLLVTNIVFLIEGKSYIHFNPDIAGIFCYILAVLAFLIVLAIIFIIFYPKKIPERYKTFFPVSLDLFFIPFIILILSSAFLVYELTSFANKYIIFNGLSYKWAGGKVFVLFLFFLVLRSIILIIRKKGIENLFHREKVTIIKLIILGILLIPIVYVIYDIRVLSNIWNSDIYPMLIFIIIFLSVAFWILFNDERKNHPNLDNSTSLKKVVSLLLIGLMFSFFANLLMSNYEYKDFLDKYNLIDEIWENAFDKTDAIPYNIFSKLKFNASHVSDSTQKKIKKLLSEKESSHVDAEKEEYYYLPLEQLEITKNGKEFYPVLKRINVLGFEIITLPSVLFINTILTLLLAVLIQVILNHKKFLEGGKA